MTAVQLPAQDMIFVKYGWMSSADHDAAAGTARGRTMMH
jgi:hypothetical protein